MIAALDPRKVPVPTASHPEQRDDLTRTVSASRLNTFHGCRLKFYFRYVQQITKPASPALHIGKCVHAVLQAWNLARWRNEEVSPEASLKAFEASWTDLQKANPIQWEDDEPAKKAQAWSLLEAYFKDTPVPLEERPLGVEVKVEAPLEDRGLPTLVGVIDLVRPGGTIVDFKTTSTTPQPHRAGHQHATQLACYGLLYREATGQVEAGFELHHLVKLKVPKVVVCAMGPMTPSEETRLFKLIESYVEGVSRMDYVPSPSMACMQCEYFAECRKWG